MVLVVLSYTVNSVYMVMMTLGIDGCDQDNSKVEASIKLMFRFTGELPGSKE